MGETKTYRRRPEIIKDMLIGVGDTGAKKTHIWSRTYLSHKLQMKYLEDILNIALIEFNGKSLYIMTTKGRMYLRLYEDYERRCKNFELAKKALEKIPIIYGTDLSYKPHTFRRRPEHIRDILQVVEDSDSTKTNIYNSTHIHLKRLNQYIDEISKTDLIKLVGKLFTMTSEGEKVLELLEDYEREYKNLDRVNKAIEIMLKR